MSKVLFLGGSLAATAFNLPSEAWAEQDVTQTSSANYPSVKAEIFVTFQNRAENVQGVPITISAFGGSALAERQIADVAVIGNITPNVNLDPGVDVYLDGIYLARTLAANFDIPDVERVEILQGPRGAPCLAAA